MSEQEPPVQEPTAAEEPPPAQPLRFSVGRLLAILAGAVVIFGVILFATIKLGYVELEWRGTGIPDFVWKGNRASPDFDQLEAHRKKQATTPVETLAFDSAAPWPGFRGTERDGLCQEVIRLDWVQTAPVVLWSQPTGGGHASFAVARGRAFTLEQRRDQEAVVAYHLETGRELWKHEYHAEFNDQWTMGDIGPRATPAWDEGRVYTLGAEGHLFCLNEETGVILWEANVLSLAGNSNLAFGMSASPLVVGDLLIVAAGNGAHSVLALNKANGEVVWRSPAGKGAYTSPMVTVLGDEKQLLITGAAGPMGISLTGGEVLWKFPWEVSHDNNIAQPVVIDGDRVFISAGYGKGCVMLAITHEDGQWRAEEQWHNRFMKNKFSSSVHLDGHLYGLDDTILTCLDAATGKRKWKGNRYGYGQLLMVLGHLVIVTGTEGELALVKATPDQPVEVARFKALGARTWNHPVIANGKLLIRNAKTMTCYDVSTSTEPIRP